MKKTDKMLKNELRSVYDGMPDIKDGIKSRIDFAKYAAVDKKKKPARAKRIFALAIPTAFLLVAAVCLGVLLPNGGTIAPPDNGYVYARLSINPSVEIKIDDKGIVVAQKGLNKDGVTLLYKKNLVGMSAEAASAYIIAEANKYGYLDNAEQVRLNVVGNNDGYAGEILTTLKSTIQSQLVGKSVVTPQDDAVLIEEAREHGMSVEKWQLVKLCINKGYSEAKLKKMDIEDLLDILDDEEELEGYLSQIEGDIRSFLNDGIAAAEDLAEYLAGIEGEEEEQVPREVRDRIKEYAETYAEELLEEVNKLTYEDVKDIAEEIADDAGDMREALEELDEDGDEITDILEDWLDSYKKWQKKRKVRMR